MIQLLTSPSYALLKTALAKALTAFQGEGMVEFVDGASVPIPEWLPLALGGSLWAEQKVTVISQAYFFGKASGRQAASKDQDDTMLISLLEDKASPVQLIFVYQGDVDERLSLMKLIKKHHQWQDFPIPKKEAWPALCSPWLTALNVQCQGRALTTLIQRTYPDVDRLYQELQKLASVGSVIEEATVLNLVRPNLEDNVFELTNHLMNDQLALAIKTFQDLMVIQVEPTLLVSLLGKHFQLFAKVSYLLGEKQDAYAMSKALNVHEFRIRLMAQAARRFSQKRINRLLLSLAQLDETIKKGRQDKVEALSWWIVNFPTITS